MASDEQKQITKRYIIMKERNPLLGARVIVTYPGGVEKLATVESVAFDRRYPRYTLRCRAEDSWSRKDVSIKQLDKVRLAPDALAPEAQARAEEELERMAYTERALKAIKLDRRLVAEWERLSAQIAELREIIEDYMASDQARQFARERAPLRDAETGEPAEPFDYIKFLEL